MSYLNKLFIALSLALLPYFLLICFCHPSGDDFSYAVLGTKQGILDALLDEYQLWNGRYTSNIFVLKNPLIFSDSWLFIYRLSILGILLFALCSVFVFFRYFLKDSISTGWIVFCTLLFLLLNLFQMPILSEGTYWYTGVVTYQLANAFTLLYLVGIHRFSSIKNIIFKVFAFFWLSLSVILIAGFNEVIMLLMLVFHGLVVYIQFTCNNKNSYWFLGLLLASIMGFLLVYFAPGNRIREAYFTGESHRFTHSLLHTGLQILRFGFDWLSNGVLILLSLLFLSIHSNLKSVSIFFKNRFYINKWISLVGLITVLFLAIFPAYWSTGIMGQHRTVNTAYFYFILLWFINLSLWSESEFIQKIRIKYSLKKYALFVSIVLITCTENSFFAWKDLISSDAKMYDLALKQRYNRLNAIPKSVNQLQELSELAIKPRSIFIYDITKDPKYFPNTCYKSYWKLKSYIISK